MGLIKSTNAPPTLSAFSMKDVEDVARSMLLKARAQAEQLLAAAQEEGEKFKQAAHAEGLAEGKKQGLAEGSAAGQAAGKQQALADHSQQLTAVLEALTTATSDLDQSRHQLHEQATGAVIELAISIARKVTRMQGEANPAVAIATVESAARLVVESNDVRILINPKQRQTLSDALPALKMKWPALAHVELVDDASIAAGGCIIRTRGGIIDADLDQQIDRIATELLPQSG